MNSRHHGVYRIISHFDVALVHNGRRVHQETCSFKKWFKLKSTHFAWVCCARAKTSRRPTLETCQTNREKGALLITCAVTGERGGLANAKKPTEKVKTDKSPSKVEKNSKLKHLYFLAMVESPHGPDMTFSPRKSGNWEITFPTGLTSGGKRSRIFSKAANL